MVSGEMTFGNSNPTAELVACGLTVNGGQLVGAFGFPDSQYETIPNNGTGTVLIATSFPVSANTPYTLKAARKFGR